MYELNGQCHEIFDFLDFPEKTIMAVSNFSKIRGDNRSSRCTTGVIDTGGKWKKS
jgi:hypothetical protein